MSEMPFSVLMQRSGMVDCEELTAEIAKSCPGNLLLFRELSELSSISEACESNLADLVILTPQSDLIDKDFLYKVREFSEKCPVVVVSAIEDIDIRQAIYESNALAVLSPKMLNISMIAYEIIRLEPVKDRLRTRLINVSTDANYLRYEVF